METLTKELTSTADKLSNLTYNVVIETENEGMVRATVWGLLDCQASGATREEALAKVSQLLKARLSKAEIVKMEIELPKPEHPWKKFAGMFKDDPDFDDVLADIEAFRRDRDAEMEAYYRQLDSEDETK
ncbi:MAG: type II toxin-antitoxin system HicB family antitoxin [Hormoscilla sp. GM7CHS1pb]|nr:type II toxin-antitoxin system HicB family antitoxin [Hormoscilla sp. GM7CHS1pb]